MAKELPPTQRALPIALIHAREAVMLPLREMLADEHITEVQWRVLRVLVENGPQTSGQLCKKAGLLPPSFTRISATMIENGHIIRAKNNSDKRSVFFAASAAGKEIIERNQDEAAAIIDSFKAKLGRVRYELLLDLLHDLAEED